MSADAAPVVSTSEINGFTVVGSGPGIEPEPQTGKAVESDPKETLSKAASELGKKGGAAAAKARKAADKEPAKEAAKEETPEPEKAEPAKEAAPAKAPAAEDEADPEEDRPSRAKERINQLAREAKEARQELDRLRREMEEARRRPVEERRPEPEPVADEDAEPELEAILGKHEDYHKGLAEYLKARDEWRDRRQTKAQAENYERSRLASMQRALGDAVKQATADIPDFWETVPEGVKSLQPSQSVDRDGQIVRVERPSGKNWIADILVSKPEHAPGLLKHFSENSRDFERIAALRSPYDVTWEVGKLVAQVESATAGTPHSSERPAPKPEVSKAPPPVRPVTGVPSTAAGTAFRPGEDFDAWLARQPKRASAR